MYTLKLLLEDATGQVDAILFGADADAFFQGLPAQDLGASPAAAAAVQDALLRLLGRGCTRDGGPWMEVGLQAYYLDPQRPWDSRQYRVCDTQLRLAAPPPGGPGAA